jgi:hypothetical protein
MSQADFKSLTIAQVASFLDSSKLPYSTLSKTKQETMRQWLLPTLFNTATEAKIHEKIVQLFATNNDKIFVSEYMALAKRIAGSLKKGKIDPRLHSLLEYYLECADSIEPLFREGLVRNVFTRFSDSDFKAIEKKLSCLKDLSDTEKKRWETIKKRVEDANRGLVSNTYHFVRKLFGGK